MRAHRIVFSLGLAAGSVLVTLAPTSAEDYRGTWEQQMACTGDVWRLCSDQIPDANRITACLRRNTPNLSDGCRAVFESNNRMSPQQQVPSQRGHVAQPHSRVAPGSSNYDDGRL
ncbi:MAG TPA: hypothetical protein VKR55_13935 [Bradyrhizobium sp.]|uniref:hypothetical protein n=1 Tax=Bradyrhizobium sp. TaxID=376 RepID=UPI002C4E0E83|nr:hypothetical protein [Bradyrhizobium sp.]HLZ03234.1 hypothetical protein [Bradyrhizobium sp.]